MTPSIMKFNRAADVERVGSLVQVMEEKQAVQLLEKQIMAARQLDKRVTWSPEYKKWHRDTSVAIRKIFGPDSGHVKEFEEIPFGLMMATSSTTDQEFHHAYLEGFGEAEMLLRSMIDELETFTVETVVVASNPVERLIRICDRFHAVVRQVRVRHDNRATLVVNDEYDVQDLLHALLHIEFDDIRREEWTPSYAGGCSRMDFLLKTEQVVLEVKKTRKGLDAKKIGEELTIDHAHYQTHPDCKMLVCFVYDPDSRVSNPRGLESDLERLPGTPVKVLVRPQ